jgi:hypothetical protein
VAAVQGLVITLVIARLPIVRGIASLAVAAVEAAV